MLTSVSRWAMLAFLAAASMVPAMAGGGDAGEFTKLLDQRASAIVSIHYLLQAGVAGTAEPNGVEAEISGVVIDPKGLVLCSNSKLNGFANLFANMMGGGGGMKWTTTPANIKVLVGEDPDGMEAKLLTRDTELDLAWLQIANPAGRRFASVDLSQGVDAKLGDRLLAVWRKDKHFDRLAVIGEGRVAGIARKPRTLLFSNGDLGDILGLPVFTPSGQLVGVGIVQLPEIDAESVRQNPMFMLNLLLRFQDVVGGTLLPAKDVLAATQRAIQENNPKK